jgi:hypothetical protein
MDFAAISRRRTLTLACNGLRSYFLRYYKADCTLYQNGLNAGGPPRTRTYAQIGGAIKSFWDKTAQVHSGNRYETQLPVFLSITRLS